MKAFLLTVLSLFTVLNLYGQDKDELFLYSESMNFDVMKLIDNSTKIIGYNKGGGVKIIDLETKSLIFESSFPSRWTRMIFSENSDDVFFVSPSENLNYIGKVSYLNYDGNNYSLINAPMIDSTYFLNMELIDMDKSKLLLSSNSFINEEDKSLSSDLKFYTLEYTNDTFIYTKHSEIPISSISPISEKRWTYRIKDVLFDEINSAVFILVSNYPKENSYYFSVFNLNSESGKVEFSEEIILKSAEEEFELSLSQNRQNILITGNDIYPRDWNICTEELRIIDSQFQFSISKFKYDFFNKLQFIMYGYPVLEIRKDNNLVSEFVLNGGSHYSYMKDFVISPNGKIYVCAALEHKGPGSNFSIWEGDFEGVLIDDFAGEKNRECYSFDNKNDSEAFNKLEGKIEILGDLELNDLKKNGIIGSVKSIEITVHNKSSYDEAEEIKIVFNKTGNIEEIRTFGSHDDEVSEFEYRYQPLEFTSEKLYMDFYGFKRQTYEVDGYKAGSPSSGTDKIIFKYDALNRVEMIENYCNQSSMIYGKDKEVCQTVFFYYNGEGNLTGKERSTERGINYKEVDYIWKNGKLKSKIVYPGVIGQEYNYKYEILNDVIYEYRLGQGSNEGYRTIEMIMDSNDVIIGKVITSYYADIRNGGHKIRSVRTYKYMYENGYVTSISQEDKFYKETEFSPYHLDNSETIELIISRDNYGNILEVSKMNWSGEKIILQKYSYKYDDVGNWVERENLISSPREKKIIRSILYY